MVAKTPRTTRRAITSLARMPSFSARSFTEIPSVMVIFRVIGAGSLLMVIRAGGVYPFIGPSFTPRGTYLCPGRRDGAPGRAPGRTGPGGAIPAPGPTPSGRDPAGATRVGCIGRRSPGRSGGRGAPGAGGRAVR